MNNLNHDTTLPKNG